MYLIFHDNLERNLRILKKKICLGLYWKANKIIIVIRNQNKFTKLRLNLVIN